MKFLKLHAADDGKEIFVNSDRIDYLEVSNSGKGAYIFMANDVEITVKEHPQVIMDTVRSSK